MSKVLLVFIYFLLKVVLTAYFSNELIKINTFSINFL